jgi:hypothetical protein
MKKIRIIPFIAIVVAAAVVFAILSVFARRSLGVSMGSFWSAFWSSLIGVGGPMGLAGFLQRRVQLGRMPWLEKRE